MTCIENIDLQGLNSLKIYFYDNILCKQYGIKWEKIHREAIILIFTL